LGSRRTQEGLKKRREKGNLGTGGEKNAYVLSRI